MEEIEKSLGITKEEAIRAYINKQSSEEYYIRAFEKFDKNGGVDKFQWHWSWWAFGGTFFYLWYRKLYKEAIILFVILIVGSFLPPLNLFITIGCGGFLPFLVYKRYKKNCEIALKHNAKGEEAIRALKWVGGVNNFAIVGAIVLHLYIIYVVVKFQGEIENNLFNIQEGKSFEIR